MSDQEKKRGLQEFISLIILVVGFIIELPEMISKGLEAIQKPGIFTVFASLVVLIAMASASYVLLKSKEATSKLQRILAVSVLIIGAIVILISIGFWVGSRWQTRSLGDLPLEVAYSYDFDDVQDPTDVTPWEHYPITKTHRLLVSTEQDFVHSGKGSLRLTVDLQPYHVDRSLEYGGIGITNLGLQGVRAITAWVLIPESEQVRNKIFRSHLMAYMYDQNGDPIGFFSETEELAPGVWTPVFLGAFYSNDSKHRTFEWDGTVDELYLTVWSDQSYTGSIYFDDITIYGDAAITN